MTASAATLNAALTDICRQLLDEWELTPEQIANLAKDIPGECASMIDNRAEQAWLDQQQREPHNTAYRRDMIAAGRGHLLGG